MQLRIWLLSHLDIKWIWNGCTTVSQLPAALRLFLWITATREFKLYLQITFRNRIYPISHLLVPTSSYMYNKMSNILMNLFKHSSHVCWVVFLLTMRIQCARSHCRTRFMSLVISEPRLENRKFKNLKKNLKQSSSKSAITSTTRQFCKRG